MTYPLSPLSSLFPHLPLTYPSLISLMYPSLISLQVAKVSNQPSIAVGGENFVFVHGAPQFGQLPMQLVPFSNILGKARDVAELCFTD